MATMNKAQAEAILELDCAYDYKMLRSAYRELSQKYHPDHCAANGMDARAASDFMADINEAHDYLKTLFADDPAIHIIPEAAKSEPEREQYNEKTGAAQSEEQAANAYSAASKAYDAYNAAKEKDYVRAAEQSAQYVKEKKSERKQARRAKESTMPFAYKFCSHFPYRITFFAIVCAYILISFGGLNIFPDIAGMREPSGSEFIIWYLILAPLATLNLAVPIVTSPLRALLLAIIDAGCGAKNDMCA